MGEKDKIEKLLEDYPDVFADIINVLVYQGEEVVKPEELRTTNIRSQYKASDDVLHEEERDTLKEWNNKKGFKVLFGIENQTIKDKKMPLRVIAYDGASYRSQMLKKGAKEFCKVITLILHFGDNQWKDDKELREVINQESVNEELFQNYKLNVFDIAYLTEEQIKMFKKTPLLLPKKEHFEVDKDLYKELLGQGFSMGFMSCIVSAGSVILQYGINN